MRLGKKPEEILSEKDWNHPEKLIDDALAWQSPERHIVYFNHPCFPAALKEIADPPLVLFVQGKPTTLQKNQIAVVGSRNPSLIGKTNAQSFSALLARDGFVITSGLARGIDAIAHRSSLEKGGETVAVLGSGHRRIYPKEHTSLADAIAHQGAVVSEFFPSAPRLPTIFLVETD